MAATLEDKLSQLSPERRQRVEEMAAALILEENTLRSLRELLEVTQLETAERLGLDQEGISHIEQHRDIKLSTLHRYVKALGGSLDIIASFPDKPPMSLTNLAKPIESDI